MEIRLTATGVEIFNLGQQVASHLRSYGQGRYVTAPEHMPKAHQQQLEWSPSRTLNWAGTIGPHTVKLVQTILESRPHPEQGYRACLGVIRLSRYHPADRIEAAASSPLACGATSYRSLKSILEKGLDQALMATLASSQWLRNCQNVITNGPTGVDKTYIACGLAHAACRPGCSAH